MDATSLMAQFRAMSSARDQELNRAGSVASSSEKQSEMRFQYKNVLAGLPSPQQQVFTSTSMAHRSPSSVLSSKPPVLLDADDLLPGRSPDARTHERIVEEDCFNRLGSESRAGVHNSSTNRNRQGGVVSSPFSSPAGGRVASPMPAAGPTAADHLYHARRPITTDFNGIAVPLPACLTPLPIQQLQPQLTIVQRSIPSAPRQQQPDPGVVASAAEELYAIASVVAQARGVADPRSALPPPDVAEHFARVVRSGTYLIKYSRIDSPHERFFTLMIARQRRGDLQTLLSCSLHANSSAPEAAYDLSELTGVALGVSDVQPFHRFLDKTDPRWISGPIMKGSTRALLPSTLAFTAVFGQQIVCLLAASEQVYEGWISVLNFISSIGRE